MTGRPLSSDVAASLLRLRPKTPLLAVILVSSLIVDRPCWCRRRAVTCILSPLRAEMMPLISGSAIGRVAVTVIGSLTSGWSCSCAAMADAALVSMASSKRAFGPLGNNSHRKTPLDAPS